MFLFSFFMKLIHTMKGFYLVFIILISSLGYNASAQRSNGLTVEGTVTVEQGSVDGAVIEMYLNGRRLDNYGIGSNGKYKVELNYNNEFVLIFSRKNNFSQKVVVDTHVPQEVLQADPLFPPFPVNVKLFTEIAGIDKTFSENTVMKIYYSDKVDNFISDLFYNDAQIKHLIDQAIAQSQQIGREAGFLAGLTKAELAELKKEYDKLIKEAENEYNREEFLTALDGYKAANKIFPGEQYPKDRIAEINDLLGLLMVAEEMEQALNDRLRVLISQGDLQFEQKQYEEARASYQRALSIDPENNRAQLRLAEINDVLNNLQTDKEYKALITAADNSFDELLYAEARNIYSKALELKSNEKYPQQKIGEIDQILKQQALNAEKLKGYSESVFQAELNFEKQFYDKAISFYENALMHKPGDEPATRKIEEIKTLMSQLANQTLYDKRIKTADRAFKKEQYDEALLEYEEAAKLMPSEQHPLSRIKQINEIFAEQERLAAEAEAEKLRLAEAEKAAEKARLAAVEAEKENRYNNAVSRADSLFLLKKYEDSRKAYQAALQVMPEESLPEQRIKQIDELILQLAVVQEEYTAAVSRGDAAFRQESFEAAKTAFQEAHKVKPEENYPNNMISQIDSITETRERLVAEAEAEKLRLAAEAEAAEHARLAVQAAEKKKQFELIVLKADSLFQLKEYIDSKEVYLAALQLMPGENFPEQRIKEIEELLVEQAEIQQAYDAAVKRGDDALLQESHEIAKAAFMEATQVKPEETYPVEMISKIDSMIETSERLAAEAEAERVRLAAEEEAAEQARLAAVEAETERKYKQAVIRADSLFNLKEYESSLSAYRVAQQVKPAENLPEQRINEITELIAQLASVQQIYDAAVTRGNDAFSQELFEEAKTAYLDAQQAKPEESYPRELLAQIDSIVDAREKLAADAEAERLRLAAEAEAAEQERLAALEADKEKQFNQVITRADSLYKLNEYENSLSAYKAALQVKPEESLPQQRITEINELIVRIATAQQNYNDAVSRGDNAFRQESFEVAKAAFLEAQQIKPEENYPQEMLTQIDSTILTRERMAAEAEAERARLAAEAEAAEQARLAALKAEKEQQYIQAVFRADSLFNLKDYENSLLAYQLALQIDGEIPYPKQRIGEINKTLEEIDKARLEQEKLNKDYQDVISLADQQFNVNEFAEAKINYEKAIAIKPEESYPKDKIAKADLAIQQLELDNRYKSVILAADDLFQQELFTEAKTEYQNSLELKPDEGYPKDQIVKIDNLLKQLENKALAEQQAVAEMERRRMEIEKRQQAIQERQEINETGLNQMYKEYISLADGFFDNRNYNVSRAWYYKAWDIKQNETYPKRRIDEINKLVGSLQLSQRDRDYQQFVDLADSTFRENQLAVSRGWYNRALSIKPNEAYPKEQLQAIADLIAERMAGRSGTQFENFIKNAAEAMETKNYNVARYWYKQALELRPEDEETKEKLDEIQKALN